MVGSDDENGPKQRQTRRLGHRYVFFLEIIFFIFQLMNYATYRFYLSIEDMKEGRVGSGNENRPKRRQMRRLGQ